MAQVVVDDKLVSYTDTGKGDVLLCVHGWMHDKDSFQQLSEELNGRFRLIALDLPNFGQSQTSEDVISVDDYGDFLGEFINKLELTDYTLIGHSMGGQIAIRASANGTIKPSRLVLVASAGVRGQRKMYKRLLKFTSKLLKYIVPKKLKAYFYKAIGSDYSADLSDVHKKIINQTLSTDVVADASRLDLPVLLIYGSLDTSTPVWMGRRFKSAISNSRLEIIDGQDHWVHQTSPKKTANLIRDFIG